MWRTRRRTWRRSGGRAARAGTASARSRSCGWSGWRRCGTHAITSAALGPYTTSELVLADELLGWLRPGMLCLADRGFYSFERFQKAHADRGAAALAGRLERRSFEREQALGDGSYLTHIQRIRHGRDRHTATPARVVDYTLEDPGLPASEQRYRLVTTLLDPDQAPATELAAPLPRTLGARGVIDELKTHQRGPRIVLRSKHPDGVLQEAYGYLCTHYAIRRLMHDAALRADLDPDRLSFTRGLRAARRSTRSHPGFSPPQPHRGT